MKNTELLKIIFQYLRTLSSMEVLDILINALKYFILIGFKYLKHKIKNKYNKYNKQ